MAHDDDELRAAAFAWLRRLISRTGGVVTRHQLRAFEFRGTTVSLEQHMRGIRHIEGHPAALSILTTYAESPENRPYEDDLGSDGYPRYKWQGASMEAADNVAVREAMRRRKPLIWFVPVAKSLYEPLFPVWIVDEEPAEHQFIVALDEAMAASWQKEAFLTAPDLVLRREYALAAVRRRLHQPLFRRQVLAAYRQRCALCRLHHPELLDAAHIKEDSEGGEPVITNGIAMCAIHHRAFDADVLGVRPDFIVQIRKDVREERDGPTLQHALQGLHERELLLPRAASARPSVELLEERFERFLKAG